ncbi:MAG: TraB/GumN family protein [Sphingomicrobium sp.]
MLKTILHRGMALLGLAALGSCAAATPPAAPVAKPALWQVSDADTTVYLFGTIHLLPEQYRWRSAAFDTAIRNSQSLIVETIVDEKHPEEISGVLMRLGLSTTVPPLTQRVAPDKRAALKAAIAKSGLPETAFDHMETWAAAFMLLGNQFRDLGLKGTEGVESVLRGNFTAAGKPVGQLETNAEQLGFFDTLPEEAQRALLEGAIEQPEAMRDEFDSMLKAWTRGDVEEIAKTFNADLASSPALMDALIRRRNANWSHWVERRLATPGTVMVAVGAGHLAGDGSVIAMLQRDGYKVRRVQ